MLPQVGEGAWQGEERSVSLHITRRDAALFRVRVSFTLNAFAYTDPNGGQG